MAKRGERTPREKQQALKGMEPIDIPDLTVAAEAYDDAMQERVRLTKEETEAQDALLAAMRKHKRQNYRTPGGLIATLVSGKDKVKVKRANDLEPTEEALD